MADPKDEARDTPDTEKTKTPPTARQLEAQTNLAFLVWTLQPLHREQWGCEGFCDQCQACGRHWHDMSGEAFRGPAEGDCGEIPPATIAAYQFTCPILDSEPVRRLRNLGASGGLSGTVLDSRRRIQEMADEASALGESLTGLAHKLAKDFGFDAHVVHSHFGEERLLSQPLRGRTLAVRAQAELLKQGSSALVKRVALPGYVAGEDPETDRALKCLEQGKDHAREALRHTGRARRHWSEFKSAMERQSDGRRLIERLREQNAHSPELAEAEMDQRSSMNEAETAFIGYWREMKEAIVSLAAGQTSLAQSGLGTAPRKLPRALNRHAAAIQDLLDLFDTWRSARAIPDAQHCLALFKARYRAASSAAAAARMDVVIAQRVCGDLGKRIEQAGDDSCGLVGALLSAQDELASRESEARQALLELACLNAIADLTTTPMPDANLPIWRNSGVMAPLLSWLCRGQEHSERPLGDWLSFAMHKAVRSLREENNRREQTERSLEQDAGRYPDGPADCDDGVSLDEVMKMAVNCDLADCVGLKQTQEELERYRDCLIPDTELLALNMAENRPFGATPDAQYLRRARRKIATWLSEDLFLSHDLDDPRLHGSNIIRRLTGFPDDRRVPGIDRLKELQAQSRPLMGTCSFKLTDRVAAVLGRALVETDPGDWRRQLYTDNDEMNQAVAWLHQWFLGDACLDLATETGAEDAVEILGRCWAMLENDQAWALAEYMCAQSGAQKGLYSEAVGDSLAAFAILIGHGVALKRCLVLPRMCELAESSKAKSLEQCLGFARSLHTLSAVDLQKSLEITRKEARYLRAHRVAFLETVSGLLQLFPGWGAQDARDVIDRLANAAASNGLEPPTPPFSTADQALALMVITGRVADPVVRCGVPHLDQKQQQAATEWLRCQLMEQE